jgi:2,4-diaminopentanoate dehydrogenase
MSRLRLVHVGLGPIGLAVARAAADRSDVASVAAVDPLFAGRDLGELLGGPASGVPVAADLAGAMAGGAVDVALHCTGSHLAQVESQLHALIEAGLDVVSTCEELAWPWFHHPAEAGRLDAAARAAGVRLLGTGVNPGFVMDLLPVVLSAMTLRVDAVTVERVVNASLRRKPLQLKIGSGLSPDEFRARGRAGTLGHMGLLESVAMIGAAMGWEIDAIEQTLDPLVADAAIRTDALEVAAGEVRGLHQVATGSVGGERRITLDLTMMLDAPDPRDVVRLDGQPNLRLRMEGGIHGDVATVAAVVGAVPRLQRAPVGLVSVLDLPAAATAPVAEAVAGAD